MWKSINCSWFWNNEDAYYIFLWIFSCLSEHFFFTSLLSEHLYNFFQHLYEKLKLYSTCAPCAVHVKQIYSVQITCLRHASAWKISYTLKERMNNFTERIGQNKKKSLQVFSSNFRHWYSWRLIHFQNNLSSYEYC